MRIFSLTEIARIFQGRRSRFHSDSFNSPSVPVEIAAFVRAKTMRVKKSRLRDKVAEEREKRISFQLGGGCAIALVEFDDEFHWLCCSFFLLLIEIIAAPPNVLDCAFLCVDDVIAGVMILKSYHSSSRVIDGCENDEEWGRGSEGRFSGFARRE